MAEALNMSQSPSERESMHYSSASAFCNPAEASRESAAGQRGTRDQQRAEASITVGLKPSLSGSP